MTDLQRELEADFRPTPLEAAQDTIDYLTTAYDDALVTIAELRERVAYLEGLIRRYNNAPGGGVGWEARRASPSNKKGT